MPVPPILIEALTRLSDALDDPVTNLRATLDALADDLTASIPRYLGLTVTVQVNDDKIIANTLNRTSSMVFASSMTLTLLPPGASAATGIVVLYSGARGVFTAVARDARWIFNLDGPPVVDNHLVSTFVPSEPVGTLDLNVRSDFDQAVHALVQGGQTPNQARAEIRRRAIRYVQTLPQAARLLLAPLKLRDRLK